MKRINLFRNTAGSSDSVAWGKQNNLSKNLKSIVAANWGSLNALFFAVVLIACALTVGCSSDKPKPVVSENQIPMTPIPSAAPMAQPASLGAPAESKPAAKKVVHRKPATVNYSDKIYGVTFEYPRRYAIETGDAATQLLLSSPLPMNFIQPGGVALAAVELPETGFANTDFSSAFFDVSVHKDLTPDQCSEFAVPLPKSVPTPVPVSAQTPALYSPEPNGQPVTADASKPSTTTPVEVAKVEAPKADATPASASADATGKPASAPGSETAAQSAPEPQGATLLLGDLDLRGTEAVSGEGTRQSDSKYFHVFQNGACYEFALNVTTVASEDAIMKHVDRDKVFDRLEKIMATVKIATVTTSPVTTPEVTAQTPATPSAPITPAQ